MLRVARGGSAAHSVEDQIAARFGRGTGAKLCGGEWACRLGATEQRDPHRPRQYETAEAGVDAEAVHGTISIRRVMSARQMLTAALVMAPTARTQHHQGSTVVARIASRMKPAVSLAASRRPKARRELGPVTWSCSALARRRKQCRR